VSVRKYFSETHKLSALKGTDSAGVLDLIMDLGATAVRGIMKIGI